MSAIAENSIEMLSSKEHDDARQARGLETAEEAMKADYPMVDIGKHRLRYSTILLWALPFLGWFACKYSKTGYMRVFYVEDYPQASLGIISLFSVLAVIVDAFTDPLIANITDNFNPSRLHRFLRGPAVQEHRIGRRAAFVLAGGAMTWVSVFLGFWPLVPSGVAASLWYGVFHVGFKLADTTLNIAHNAWALDMTPSNTDRDKLWASRELMNSVGIVVGTLVTSGLRHLGGLHCIENRNDGCLGLPISGAIFGGLLFAALVLWLCTAKERVTERLPLKPPSSAWSAEGVVPMLITACINRPFFFVLATEVTEAFGETMPISIFPFYAHTVIGEKCTDAVSATINGITFFLLARMFSLPLWRKLGSRVGPYYALLTHSFAEGLAHLPFVIPGRDDESCTQTYIMYAACVGWGLTYSGNYLRRLVSGSCVDYDTFITGKNREAQYPTILNFVPKFWEAFAEGVPLLLLAYFGYVRKESGGEEPEQPWAVSAVSTACMSLVPAAFLLGGAAVLCGFPKAARPKYAHRALQNAIRHKHALGKECMDPWCPSRILAPPPALGSHHGILSFFFPFELRWAVMSAAESAEVARTPNYGALMLVPAVSVCLGTLLAIPAIFFFILGLDDLGDALGASVSVPALIALGFALALNWFGSSRLRAAIEVKRLGIPVAEILQQYNFTCRFTMRAPLMQPEVEVVAVETSAESSEIPISGEASSTSATGGPLEVWSGSS